MFSRNADRPAPPGTAPVPGVRDVSPPMPSPSQLHLETTVVARAANVFGRPWARRALDAVTGTVLVTLGLKLLGDGSET